MRKKVYSGAPWEKKAAYSRATRVRDLVFVSGTAAFDENGQLVGRGNMFEQSDYSFAKIGRALEQCGASIENVVRTRSFVRDMSDFDEYARAHRKHFEGIDPVSTCVQVGGFVDPDMLVEIEVDAVIDG
jgi:enamine deaminase RidA (YjgF/YER057c/UK114 family)